MILVAGIWEFLMAADLESLPVWIIAALAIWYVSRQEIAERNGGNRVHKSLDKLIERQEKQHKEEMEVLRLQPETYLQAVMRHYPVEEERKNATIIHDIKNATTRIEARLDKMG